MPAQGRPVQMACAVTCANMISPHTVWNSVSLFSPEEQFTRVCSITTNIKFFAYEALISSCFVCKHVEKVENFKKKMVGERLAANMQGYCM